MSSLMQLRVFQCHECGHKMRLSGDHCGRCHAIKPAYQGLIYRLALLSPVLVIGVVGIVVLSLV
ncbi:hypothetical protein [Frigidibacter sp.]|uniref:hypothetical protein n=1 Tax=Frigidibacter sp. TaxID=2586418 RepID=UPI002732D761|nr:hypothetical protein [Frigidibacter sp.]MDP3339981.1 hypothetical protein [Frigidibacter sp.]